MIFYSALAGFTAGVFIRSIVIVDFYTASFIFFLASVVLLISYTTSSKESSKDKFFYTKFLAIFVITCALGVMRFNSTIVTPLVLPPGGVEVTFKGVVVDEPDVRENQSKLTLRISPDQTVTKEGFSGNVLIIGERYTDSKYGDEVLVSGKIKNPENYVDKGDTKVTQESFDYVSYLAKDGIYYQMIRPTIEVIGSGHGNPIKDVLFKLKHAFLSSINQQISEPESSLLAGLVVGAKQSLGKELLEDFRIVGVIHVVVLSGYNLTIVAQAMMRVFSFMPRVASLSLGGAGIIFFAIMTGGSATVVRASIMALLVLFAEGIRRDYDITRALLLAGFFMVMQNPHILVFDPSFQLSFLATVALIYLAPYIKKYFTWIPSRFGLQELAISTIATQLFVLPLLLYSMGTLSLVALPVNLLILPLIPITMFSGFMVGIIGFISSTLALPFVFITHLLLWYELKIVELFASLPFASVSISYFPFLFVTVIYIGFTVLFFLKKKAKVNI